LPSLRKPRRPRALERRRARRLRALRLPLLILTFLAIAATLVVARTLFVPLVLAAFVGMGLNPIVAGLRRIYVPRVLGALLIMVGLIVGLSEAAVLLTAPAAEWIREAPQAIHQLAPKIRQRHELGCRLRPSARSRLDSTRANHSGSCLPLPT